MLFNYFCYLKYENISQNVLDGKNHIPHHLQERQLENQGKTQVVLEL